MTDWIATHTLIVQTYSTTARAFWPVGTAVSILGPHGADRLRVRDRHGNVAVVYQTHIAPRTP